MTRSVCICLDGSVNVTNPILKNMYENKSGKKIYVFTASKLTMTYTHECVSNLLNAAGIKAN